MSTRVYFLPLLTQLSLPSLRLHDKHRSIFRAFILLDPGIAAYEDLEYVVKLLGSQILKKKDTWASRASAYAELRTAIPYSRFHPDALASFIVSLPSVYHVDSYFLFLF